MKSTLFTPFNKYFFFISLSVLLLGSSCMTTTSLEVLQPAAFGVPDHISTLATVNRSRPGKKVGNVIEGLFTGEAIGQDKSGARRATEGLTYALTQTPRFSVKYTGIEMIGKGSYDFPEPLPWSVVDSICRAYGTDAVVAIEKFDSNIRRDMSSRERQSKDKEGNVTKWTEYRAEMHTQVKLGWRLYDPVNRVIIDEFEVWEELGWDGTGRSESQANGGLPGQVSAVNDVSYAAGRKYGMRIAPTWVRVSRSFYHKGKGDLKSEMKSAARFAKVDRFTDAAVIWKPIAENSTDPKMAGRAAYNMALAAEWEGKLDLAYEWAKKSYTEYGNTKARSYMDRLQFRIHEQEQLREQMNEN
ncbi:MAG: hypothetical protein KDD63_08250 [Bacteroidetes bacterium]|nr:hypothetical protein [Bacteroidota bacterium]